MMAYQILNNDSNFEAGDYTNLIHGKTVVVTEFANTEFIGAIW